MELSVANRMVIVYVDGKKVGQRMFFAPVPAIERVMFRTGAQRTYPTVDTPADWYGILPDAGEQEPLCTYRIANFKTASADKDAGAAFLKYKDFKPYVDYFNSMEDENIAQAIPNARASQWMEENIPEGLTVFAFPVEHRRFVRTTNSLERVNKEIRRRTRVVGVFSNGASCLRLVSALFMEISEEWQIGKHYCAGKSLSY